MSGKPSSRMLFEDGWNVKTKWKRRQPGVVRGGAGWCACVLALVLAGHAAAQQTQQVDVSVRIIEFQTLRGMETGLSAYFKQRNEPRPYGRVSSGNGAITNADITFPSSTTAGITVFLDRITNQYGDFELVLQALVDQNRAAILSRPKAVVPVGAKTPTVIQTTQDIPYESTTVVGSTAVQITQFEKTGVLLEVQALELIDDDGNPETTEDIFIKLQLHGQVQEEGQRITVALDDLLAVSGGIIQQTSNAIRVPEFVTREFTTTVWVRHGQVLVLGGLYRNTKNKDLATLPWLTTGQDVFNSMVQRVSPFAVPSVPITTGLGNQRVEEGRRELVFLVKSTLKTFTEIDEFEFVDEAPAEEKDKKPTDVIRDITDIPQELVEGIAGDVPKDEVSESLGGEE